MLRAKTLSALASLVVLGAASPLFAGDGLFFGFHFGGGDRDRDRHSRPVVISRPVVVHREPTVVYREPTVVYREPVVVRAVEEIPCDLSLSAYQSGDTVIVIARGTNRASGFTTSFSGCETGDRFPQITFHNFAPAYYGTSCATAFELSGSFHTQGCLSSLEVKIGDTCRRIAVIQAGRIS